MNIGGGRLNRPEIHLLTGRGEGGSQFPVLSLLFLFYNNYHKCPFVCPLCDAAINARYVVKRSIVSSTSLASRISNNWYTMSNRPR